jgi:hypothetical protein
MFTTGYAYAFLLFTDCLWESAITLSSDMVEGDRFLYLLLRAITFFDACL